MNNDTIAAIATGLKAAGISIIRISGEDAFDVADRIFRSKSGISVNDMKSYTVSYGHIVDMKDDIGNNREKTESNYSNTESDRLNTENNQNNTGNNRFNSEKNRKDPNMIDSGMIDEVLLIKMAAPSTYTRENIVEIDCHGGIAVTRKVLECVLHAGARLAEPGEFTKRAFLNGRIDLTQAEAVSDLIASDSEAAVRNSLKQLNGNIREKISELRNELLTKTAYIEAALDDPEHISLDGFDDELTGTVKRVYDEINALIKSFDNGRIIKNGINTVILGSPNVGKSSLMNRLLGQDRAIVTDIPGTTRDTLSESVSVGGIQLNIIDTAGIRETEDVIEKIGVDRARKAAEDADLVLFVLDSSRTGVSDDEKEELKKLTDEYSSKKTVILLNKSDISDAAGSDTYIGSLKETLKNIDSNVVEKNKDIKENSIPIVMISAKTGEGTHLLEKCISDMFFSGMIDSDDNIYISSMRHKELLEKSAVSLKNVMSAIEQGMSEDFYTIDLMDAYTALGLITGEHVEDELANKIFSEFCMGK